MNTPNGRVCKAFILLTLLLVCTAFSSSVKLAIAAANVETLSNAGYIDSAGNYYVVGEVKNTGNKTANFVQVTARFYDSRNVFIDSRFDLTTIYTILPGRKSPFQIALLDVAESARVDHYSLSVTFMEASSRPLGISILSHYSYTDTYGQIHIVRLVRNVGSQRASNVKIAATYYDISGGVVAVSLTSLDPELQGEFNPNTTQVFEIQLNQERTLHTDTYLLTTESSQYATTAELPGLYIDRGQIGIRWQGHLAKTKPQQI